MFETLDPHESGTIETLNVMFSSSAELFGNELAILSREAWTRTEDGRAMERTLMARARDLAADGWRVAQDRAQRVGILIHGDGTIWATLRHDGEHVAVMVGLEAESIRAGVDPILDAVRRAGQAETGAWLATQRGDRARKAARRLARESRTTAFGARMRRAAFVPGTPEHGEHHMWIRCAQGFDQEAAWHRGRAADARVTWRAAAQRQAERAAEGGAA
jgi:hypothetical protein